MTRIYSRQDIPIQPKLKMGHKLDGDYMDSLKASEKLARQLSQVRHSKVKRLRTQITRGFYQVNAEAVAQALFMPKQSSDQRR